MIHPTAVIWPGVRIGQNVTIGAYSVVGGQAEIRGKWIGVGDVVIGDNTHISEHVVIHGPARIGADCYIMHGSHIAHHNTLGDRVTLSPYATLGGHTTVEDDATIGMQATIHQRLTIGAGSMIGMQSAVTKDVPPGRKWYGIPARDHGPNSR